MMKNNIPYSGWECVDIQDLGERAMTCQMCKRERIRYVHYMQHPQYHAVFAVGCVCAGKMEGDIQNAKERDSFMKSRINKRKNWLTREWKISINGNKYLKSDGFIVVMKKKDGLWSTFVKNKNGDFKKWSTRKSVNENEMKLAAFDCLTKVLAEEEIKKKQKNAGSFAAEAKVSLPSKIMELNLLPPERKMLEPKIIQMEPTELNVKTENKKASRIIIQGDLFKSAEKEKQFTNEQKNIFTFIKAGTGHGIIDAVAGAGKTTTIMECVKYVTDKTEVLFCAFNKSIQSEISGKFKKLGLNQVTVKTIHALGYQMLKDANKTGKRVALKEFKFKTILNTDTEVQKEIQVYLDEFLNINGYEQNETDSTRQFAIKDLIYKFKERLLDMNQKIRATLTPNDIEEFKHLIRHFNYFTETEIVSDCFNREIEIYFECGKILLDAGNALAKESSIFDFTDMLYLPYFWKLRASRTYSFLFIDECQDLSKSQLAVVLKYGQQNGRILAVGDPYQSIYGFAGADIESFNRIKNTIKANPLPLTTCFRCPPNIVALAASIRQDINSGKQEHGIIEEIYLKEVIERAQANDLIISRFREPILFILFEFINKSKQVQIHRDEVGDIINELKNLFKQEERAVVLTEISDSFDMIKEAVYNRWFFIIEKESKKLTNLSERQIYVHSKTEYLNNRLEFLHKKYLQWRGSCFTINDMLLKIKNLISAPDNCIKLSTIHRAKGLEAGRVFILNFDELPHFKPSHKPWEITQEQNLKYVAITRSFNELYLVKSEKKSNIKKDASLFDEFIVDFV